jgi:hypothetical protein
MNGLEDVASASLLETMKQSGAHGFFLSRNAASQGGH